jgi:S1-C subfamily serine protease
MFNRKMSKPLVQVSRITMPPSPLSVRWPLRVLLFGLVMLTGPFEARAAEDGLPREMLAKLKAATVFVKVEAKEGSGSGSGFVIKTEGQTAWFVTNNHVIDLTDGKAGRAAPPPTITAVFNSGTPQEQTGRAELLAADPHWDLAVLKVPGLKNAPPPIDYSQEPQLIETMPVYILGFPLGARLAIGDGNPAITVGRGTVSSIRLNERGELTVVQLDGDLNPGNSGGPVVDDKGRLVGTAVAKIRQTRISFAIPAQALQLRLRGQLMDHSFTVRQGAPGSLDVQVELGLFDPFERLRGTSFYYLLQDNPGSKKLATLPGVHKVELRRSTQRLTGQFTLSGEQGRDVALAFQAVYVNGDGKSFLSNPRVRRFRIGPTAPPPVVAQNPVAPPPKRQPLDNAGLTQALADLATRDHFRVTGAADRLAVTEPNDRRPEVLAALEQLLDNENVFISMSTSKAYTHWAAKEGVANYCKLLKSRHVQTRRQALDALAKYGDAGSAEAVAGCLTDLGMRVTASKTIQGFGAAAEKAVLPYLEHTDLFVRWEVCKILKIIGTSGSKPALQKAAGDSAFAVANAARQALEEIDRRGKP